jgi:diguanylate cyclase (GGDEF)-like protein
MVSMRARYHWSTYLTVVLVLTGVVAAVAFVVGAEEIGYALQNIYLPAVVLAMGINIVARRPKPLWPWIALLAGSLMTAISDSMNSTVTPLSMAGILLISLFIGRIPRAAFFKIDVVALFEILMVSSSVAILLWSAVISPHLDNSPVSATELSSLVAASISVGMLTYLVQGLVADRWRSPGLWSFILTLAAMTVSNSISLLAPHNVRAGLALNLACYLPASTVTSSGWIRTVVADDSDRHIDRPNRLMLAMMVLAGLTPAGIWILPHSEQPHDRVLKMVASVVITATVLLRMWITTNKQVEQERTRRWAESHDSLTGLYNRSAVLDRLGEMLPHRDAHVLVVNLGGFRSVNDDYGHEAGDSVLRAVMDRIVAATNAETEQVGRMGADEFVIVSTRQQDAVRRLGERIALKLSEPYRGIVPHVGVRVTVAIGIALALKDSHGSTALQRADIAMYDVKQRDVCGLKFFSDKIHADQEKERQLGLAIPGALERGEFSIMYQPIVALRDGCELHGFEALCRWSSDTFGFVSPAEFVPVAENTGAIRELGSMMLEESCAQLSEWQKRYDADHLHVSVNVSVMQLTLELPLLVEELLAKYSLRPECLWLEITESILLDPRSDAFGVLDRLREIGLQLAIDDFGTGSAAMGYLRDTPATVVKIDKSFVDDLGTDAFGDALCVAVIGLAKRLNMTVVAEGVEEQRQSDLLTELGCDWGQGYLYNKPLSVEAATALASCCRNQGQSSAGCSA